MPQFSRDQLERLGAKLEELGDQLTDDERQMLMTTFGLAARAMGNVEVEEVADVDEITSGREGLGRMRVARDLPRLVRDREVTLADGLISAFEPGEAGRFTGGDVAEGVEGGITIKWSK